MLLICLANLPLLKRVHAARFNVSRNAFLSSRSGKKNYFLWRWYCGKKTNRNVVYRGLYSYRQRVRVITLFPNIFFLLLLHVKGVWKRFWKESLTRTIVNKCWQRFLWLSLILWLKTNRMWFSVVCTLIDNDTGQNLLWNHFLFRHIDKAGDGHFQNLSSRYNHLRGWLSRNMTPFSANESATISVITWVIILKTDIAPWLAMSMRIIALFVISKGHCHAICLESVFASMEFQN